MNFKIDALCAVISNRIPRIEWRYNANLPEGGLFCMTDERGIVELYSPSADLATATSLLSEMSSDGLVKLYTLEDGSRGCAYQSKGSNEWSGHTAKSQPEAIARCYVHSRLGTTFNIDELFDDFVELKRIAIPVPAGAKSDAGVIQPKRRM